MPAISLRLPDDVEANLKAEAQLEGKSQSEIARLAITEYLARRERERFMAEMVAEVRSAYADPEIRREALAIAEEFDAADDALDRLIAEERAAGIDPDEKWWE
ncbi:CopG family transcriptional regulator [Methylomonas methanica]|jgi:predicted DNA-binding protein|uniref:CopG family transcriptional regulator n=1 Tax=Methylomonas methanica TaxID=421 RepID=A0A177MND9_METMH|nr:ribbon-helix-helix protein, CopG family [Methylomonas methanica]OAI06379.1 CopG family transcriptional regulator [Methylomonas methanica]OQW79208.1 MAG: CopG family transcriptional regulator [Proteobacteria bacterium ST_bin11]